MNDPFTSGIRIPVRPVADTGAVKEAEPTDPYFATGVALPTPGYDGLGAMARAFVEEFARIGWDRERIERMFRIPRYAAPFTVYRARGAAYVTSLLDQVFGPSEED